MQLACVFTQSSLVYMKHWIGLNHWFLLIGHLWPKRIRVCRTYVTSYAYIMWTKWTFHGTYTHPTDTQNTSTKRNFMLCNIGVSCNYMAVLLKYSWSHKPVFVFVFLCQLYSSHKVVWYINEITFYALQYLYRALLITKCDPRAQIYKNAQDRSLYFPPFCLFLQIYL